MNMTTKNCIMTIDNDCETAATARTRTVVTAQALVRQFSSSPRPQILFDGVVPGVELKQCIIIIYYYIIT